MTGLCLRRRPFALALNLRLRAGGCSPGIAAMSRLHHRAQLHSMLFTLCIVAAFAASCNVDQVVTLPQPGSDCYLQGFRTSELCREELALLERIAADSRYPPFRGLTAKSLADAAGYEGSLDFAAALFYQRLVADPRNQELYDYLEREEAEPGVELPDYARRKILFIVVPGMFYYDTTAVDSRGAVLRSIVRRMGVRDMVAPIEQTGTVTENGARICEFLEFVGSDYETILLASISKGGGDVKAALRLCGQGKAFERVRGWVNIGGITRGSPLVNQIEGTCLPRAEAQLYFLYKGYQWSGLTSMRSGVDAPLNFEMEIPAQITTVSVVGVPLQRHLTERSAPYYEALASYGPSDGIVLLADSYIPDGVVYAQFGSDHYFAAPLSEKRIRAFVTYLLDKAGVRP